MCNYLDDLVQLTFLMECENMWPNEFNEYEISKIIVSKHSNW
jgi:hypothetical protein